MAEKTESIYTIPLRKEWLKGPRSRRSNRALTTVRNYVKRHTKASNVKISKGVNQTIFAHGFKKPPGKIKVQVEGDLEMLTIKLPGEFIPKKVEKKTGVAGLKERLTGKPEEEKKEEAPKEEKTEEATSEEKIKGAVEKVKKEQKKSEKKEQKK